MDTREASESKLSCRVMAERLRPIAVARKVWSPKHGAIVTFTGIVRDHSDGRGVRGIIYEAYEEMATDEMRRILEESKTRWPQVRVAAHHRIGSLAVGDISVVIAAGAAHREPAFESASFVMSEIKKRAPIWKKEIYEDGEAWIGLEEGGSGAG